MQESCLFEILDLSDDSLKILLSKASSRSLLKLVAAYPRSAGKVFLQILSDCMSRPTLQFLQEELELIEVPTYAEIRAAENDLMKIVREDRLLPDYQKAA